MIHAGAARKVPKRHFPDLDDQPSTILVWSASYEEGLIRNASLTRLAVDKLTVAWGWQCLTRSLAFGSPSNTSVSALDCELRVKRALGG